MKSNSLYSQITLPKDKPFWCLVFQDHVLQYWKERYRLYPKLQRLARRFLSFIPSAALSETVWSRSGSIWTDLRYKLDRKYVVASTCLSMMYKMHKSNQENHDLCEFYHWVTDRFTKSPPTPDSDYPNTHFSINLLINLFTERLQPVRNTQMVRGSESNVQNKLNLHQNCMLSS
mmetsp:Transcript_888/g.1230  ORF Transcript_888/g.1230 Transcript_888/m.1230 type:complete len:174 (-) Transcript_888:261-782(-)